MQHTVVVVHVIVVVACDCVPYAVGIIDQMTH